MTGAEHYREAERLSEAAADRMAVVKKNLGGAIQTSGDLAQVMAVLDETCALAQVHATLALAAATVATRGLGPQQSSGWREHSVDDDAWLRVTSC